METKDMSDVGDIGNIEDIVDYCNDGERKGINEHNEKNNEGNNNHEDFISGEYFVIPKHENLDGLLMEKLNEFGVEVKYHYKSIGVYCIIIDRPEVLEEILSLDYITIEKAGKVTALSPED